MGVRKGFLYISEQRSLSIASHLLDLLILPGGKMDGGLLTSAELLSGYEGLS